MVPLSFHVKSFLSPTNSLSNVNMQNRAKVLDSDQPEKHQVLQNNQVWKQVKIKMENNLNQVWYLFQNKSFNQDWE